MKHIREQADAAQRQAKAAGEQVELMTKEAAAADARRHDEAVERWTQQAVRDSQVADQLAALSSVALALRDGARAQLQPIVFAHEWKERLYGPSDEADLGRAEVEFRYYMSNEGLGPALNVEHGVELLGEPFAFGGGMQFRGACRRVPPAARQAATQPVPNQYLGVAVSSSALPDEYRRAPTVYWCRFETSSASGSRPATRRTPAPAEFRRVEPPAPPRPAPGER